jgi:hypothetical protein
MKAMGSEGNEPEISADDRMFGQEDVAALWKAYRAGGAVKCPRDAGSLALSVDGGSRAYRFVCTECGTSSSWFETAPSGIHVRTATIPIAAPSGDD